MNLEKFILHNFAEQAKPTYYIDVPQFSVLQKAIILHDGIYLFYQVPVVSTGNTKREAYVMVNTGQPVPDGAGLVDILSSVYEVPDKPGEQAIIIFAIYKIKSDG